MTYELQINIIPSDIKFSENKNCDSFIILTNFIQNFKQILYKIGTNWIQNIHKFY